ncbi:MAG: RNA ligase (ATP) [Fibrella sp.]|nr:RNA ligase (ATP) [Armatimonadota bacterium]
MQRKLASVQRVIGIEPILNADAIELVRINGWQCVTKKGEFVPGSLGVFFEIDAIPPDDERFRFLWTPKATVEGETVSRPDKFRIRTMRLRGALSQGLFMPLPAFPEIGDAAVEGDDLTETLGVGKYEPPAPSNMGDWRGPFPPMVPKTDEMRVQSVPPVLDELRGKSYVATLKYDGTSATFVIDPRTGEFHVASRNQSLRDGNNPYWNMARKYDIEAALRKNLDIAIQGEIVGPGVQKNPLGLSEIALFVFNVYDFAAGNYLNHDDARAFLRANNIPAVETIETGESFAHTQEELLLLAEGKYPGTKNEREGIVIRPRTETFSSTLGGRLSFKAISNRYLLAERD